MVLGVREAALRNGRLRPGATGRGRGPRQRYRQLAGRRRRRKPGSEPVR
jgi:hypothetical protein